MTVNPKSLNMMNLPIYVSPSHRRVCLSPPSVSTRLYKNPTLVKVTQSNTSFLFHLDAQTD